MGSGVKEVFISHREEAKSSSYASFPKMAKRVNRSMNVLKDMLHLRFMTAYLP